MSRRSKLCCRSCRSGLTLIEVLAGLVLLGTLLVSLVLARGRATQQAALAARRLAATEAAERLLGQWWQAPKDWPRQSSGLIEPDGSLVWRTSRIDDPVVRKLGGQVVRLEILEGRTPQAAAALVSVDVVLAEEKVPDAAPESDNPGGL